MSEGIAQRPAFDELRAGFAGDVLTESDAGYEEARKIFNAAIESRPRVIARCARVDDVKAALVYARTNELAIAVRGGGHSVAGASLVDGGVVIDLRGLNSVVVDPQARTATVGGGTVWGELDKATQPHGLAVTGGRVSTTGVAGLTLGGGSGWLERAFGLAADNLLSVDLITADGREVTANATENPDLFWALHGGGGNFGIATSLTFRLHPLPAFAMALLLWPAEKGREVAGRYRDLIELAPDEIGGGLLYLTGPPEEFVPEHMVDQLCCGVLVTCVGTEAELLRQISGLLELRPEGQVITEIPYAELQCMLDDPPGFRNYWSAEYLDELPDEALDRFCETASLMVVPSPSQHALLPWGGAVARNAGTDAMGKRDARWVVHPLGLWADPADDDKARHWARTIAEQMRPWTTGGLYLNFVGDEGLERVIAGYGQVNYDRLSRVKAAFDPDNVFNRWHNVLPATDPTLRA
ncbi:MAG: FAD-binding protein [Actinophytocola sp.]|nr:FAD-binding protein [Actinophytocola sp.]